MMIPILQLVILTTSYNFQENDLKLLIWSDNFNDRLYKIINFYYINIYSDFYLRKIFIR